MRELIIDSFAGGGGASAGIAAALGRGLDYAINHDAEAIAMHTANHPETHHLSRNIWHVDPLEVVGRRPVGLAWFSPDCKHFSKAKGGRPVKRSIRDLAWTVILWAKRARPRVIILENVEEFRQWGPLVIRENGQWMPCPDRRGETFNHWVKELKRLGYRVEWRELRACDYGAPTIRKRLFLIARRDRGKIVWPEPTHGDPNSEAVKSGRLLPYKTAAEIIDWSLPCHSIFLTKEEGRAVGVKRPLAEATMRRVAKGIQRYVIEAAEPFIVNLTHHGGDRTEPLTEPMRTVTGAHRGEKALVVPMIQYAQHGGRSRGIAAPAHTVTASRKDQNLLVAAFLAQHNLGVVARDVRAPVSTITSTGSQQAVVAAGMLQLKGRDRRMSAPDEPLRTVTAGGYHHAEVRAFLIKYYGSGGQWQDCAEPVHTVPTRDRLGLVTVHGEQYQIVDIGMRMLSVAELFRAQGFPESYIIDRGVAPDGSGMRLTKTASIRMCGNSVCPPLAEALVRANYQDASMPVSARAA